MGLNITYITGEDSLVFRLSSNDVDVMEFLVKKGLEKEIGDIFGVSDFGEQCSIQRKRLLNSINRLLETIKINPQILPYTYGTKVEIPRGSGKYSTGSGTISGFRIRGQPHSIEAGLEKCELTKLLQDESGKWKDYAPKDVRDLKIIKTDGDFVRDITIGNIKIYKRRKPAKLVRNLEQLKSFLSKTSAQVIQKVLG